MRWILSECIQGSLPVVSGDYNVACLNFSSSVATSWFSRLSSASRIRFPVKSIAAPLALPMSLIRWLLLRWARNWCPAGMAGQQ
jgi:hypothetical protein